MDLPKNKKLLQIKLFNEFFNKHNLEKNNLSYRKQEILKEIIPLNISLNDFKKFNFDKFYLSEEEYEDQKKLYYKKVFYKNLETNVRNFLKDYEEKSIDLILKKILERKISYLDLYYFRENMRYEWIEILISEIENNENENRNFNNVYEILTQKQKQKVHKVLVDIFSNDEQNDLIKAFTHYIQIENIDNLFLKIYNKNFYEYYIENLSLEEIKKRKYILNFEMIYKKDFLIKVYEYLEKNIMNRNYDLKELILSLDKDIAFFENFKNKNNNLLDEIIFLKIIKEFANSFINTNKKIYRVDEYLKNLDALANKNNF